MAGLRIDEVGYWSKIKLDIVRDYASAYSTILNKQPSLKHVYIDAFAGAGVHISKQTGGFIPGSPLNALNVKPPFHEFHFIDLDGKRADSLLKLAGSRAGKNVFVYEGDCNEVLLDRVFPNARYDQYRRAFACLTPMACTSIGM